MTVMVRDETAEDVEAIAEVTRAAFADHPHSRQTEPFIIVALREAGALSVSLVAEDAGNVVGHVAFSSVTMPDGAAGWYGVGPLSVEPGRQRQGIGSALMRHGLAALSDRGAAGCVLVGDPAYYIRFGFKPWPGVEVEGVPPEYVLALPLGNDMPAAGRIIFHSAFAATE